MRELLLLLPGDVLLPLQHLMLLQKQQLHLLLLDPRVVVCREAQALQPRSEGPLLRHNLGVGRRTTVQGMLKR